MPESIDLSSVRRADLSLIEGRGRERSANSLEGDGAHGCAHRLCENCHVITVAIHGGDGRRVMVTRAYTRAVVRALALARIETLIMRVTSVPLSSL